MQTISEVVFKIIDQFKMIGCCLPGLCILEATEICDFSGKTFNLLVAIGV